MNKWNKPPTESSYVSYIHKKNNDGTFQVYWPNKHSWSKPMNKIPDHIYDRFIEISEQEAFIEIL